jgi:hypothetical protein
MSKTSNRVLGAKDLNDPQRNRGDWARRRACRAVDYWEAGGMGWSKGSESFDVKDHFRGEEERGFVGASERDAGERRPG